MLAIPSCILLDPTVTRVRDIVLDDADTTLVLTMEVTPVTAACPLCGHAARRIHSHYQRTLADVSWALVPVRIILHVRRFFCDQPDCHRQIFTERLPTITQPYARRTRRLTRIQQQIGLLPGGSLGAALCATLGYPGGVDLLLTLMRQHHLPMLPTPHVLGLDDWALRKGQRYGTIVVDHERGQIVDLLPDRTPERVSHWLREHPGVEIVTRDRAEAYAQGITDGAPAVIQVADRWHLLKNVTDALTAVLQDHRAAIHPLLVPPLPSTAPVEITPRSRQEQPLDDTPVAEAPPVVPDLLLTRADQARQARAAEVHRLHALGWLQKDIAQHLHCHPKTVHRYLQRKLPLAARRGARQSKLEVYKPYLIQRWNDGCHSASQLWRELQPRGYDGGCTILRTFVAELRAKSGMPMRSRTASARPLPATAIRTVPSSRRLAWMSTQPITALDEKQQHERAALLTVNSTVMTAVTLAHNFATMVRERRGDALEGWLNAAAHSGIAALRSLANGIRADLDAVRAALRLEWSNGRTEGCVNRLKCVRRQMYGRGKLDLLRLRLMAT